MARYPYPLILASASPRRQKILTSLKIPFEVHLPTCHEVFVADDPVATVGINARHKALSVQQRYPKYYILAADTVVSFEGRVLGKPRDRLEAEEWLKSYAGKSQIVYTAIAFAMPETEKISLRIEATSLRFKDYGYDTAGEYFDLVQPLDRAGAYDINAHGEMLIEKRVGSYTNVMGLPRSLVRDWILTHTPFGSDLP